ncbi:MAG TPA: efflux RND transporter periplasmic adaptor subunit [Vicinamibacteria bacterium]
MSGARILSLLTLSAAAAACGGAPGASGATKQDARPALRVRVAPVEVRDVVTDAKAVGSLEAEEIVQVTAEVEGAVSGVRFNEGDRVSPSTVLLLIDPNRYRLEAARAEATFQKAVADARRAASEAARREELARESLVSSEELNRARQEAERLEAEAASTRASRDWALQNRNRAEVRPSRAGVINSKTVETGKYVKMGDVLATLVDVSRLRLRFNLSESESLRVHEGQEITFTVSALGSQPFRGQVYHVGDVADPATRQVQVLSWVRNPGVLKPGFFAEVSLATETRTAALVVPEGAVQASERGFVAYVVRDGKAMQRPVKIGLRTGTGVVEILSGLEKGDIVVTEGSDRLADGVPVAPVGGAAAPVGAQ